jgi:hypothetical protein
MQKRASAASSDWQFVQRRMSGAPQFKQKRAADGFSVWQRGQSIDRLSFGNFETLLAAFPTGLKWGDSLILACPQIFEGKNKQSLNFFLPDQDNLYGLVP